MQTLVDIKTKDGYSIHGTLDYKDQRASQLIIFVEHCEKFEKWAPLLDKIQVKNETSVIKGATHSFVEEGTLNKLYDETLNWLQY